MAESGSGAGRSLLPPSSAMGGTKPGGRTKGEGKQQTEGEGQGKEGALGIVLFYFS